MRKEVQKQLQELCSEYCGCKIELEDELIETKRLSSIRLFELLCELEEMYSIEFSRDEITCVNNFSTVNNMVDIVVRKRME